MNAQDFSNYNPIKPLIERTVAQDFNRFMQDMTEQLRSFEYFLAGQRIAKDKEGNTIILQETQPRVNQIGRQEVMGRLTNLLNQNTWMSQIEPEATEKNFVVITASIYRMLAENHVKYELSLKNARVIADNMTDLILMALYKAETDKPTIYGTMQSKNIPDGQGHQNQFDQLSSMFKR